MAITKFSFPTTIHFGPGACKLVGPQLAERGIKRPIVVTDKGLAALPIVAELMADLAAAGLAPALFGGVFGNPTASQAMAGAAAFREHRADAVVGIGGGAALDVAKIVGVIAIGGGAALEYAYDHPNVRSIGADVPWFVALPTTSGTGSEVGRSAVISEDDTHIKRIVFSPNILAKTVFADPELTLGLPRELTISTGLDALSHALESIWNTNANPVSSNHAVFAASEVMASLPALAGNLGDIALRVRMSRASLFAGLAFSNTKTALAHSLSYHFTLKYGVPHGIACSFSLPMVMRSAIGRSEACDIALMRIFGADLELGAEKLAGLLDRLGVSRRPADHGAQEDEWLAVVADAFEGERGRNFIGDREIMLRIGAEAAAA